MKIKLIFAVVLSLFSTDVAHACRMFGDPIARIDPNEYMFIGSVKGYENVQLAEGVGPQRFMDTTATAVIVEVTESVHVPSLDQNAYEVVPIRYHADCRFSGPSREEIEKQFPIGSKVRVIARIATYFKDEGKPKSARIRLESPPATHSGIWLNVYNNGKPLTSADSLFDYSKSGDSTEGEYEVRVLPLFEIRKDLWRLEKSRDQRARNKILDRLVLYERHEPFFIDFKQLLRSYTSTESELLRYMEKRNDTLKTINGQ